MANNYNNNNSQEATNDQVWQNSVAFLQLLQQLDININEQLARADLQQAVQYERQLLVVLERLLKKKNPETGRSEKFEEIMPLIREVQIDIAKTNNGNYDLEAMKRRKQEEYEKIEDIYLKLGDLMYELNLIFKQGIDPAEAWIDQ